MPSLFFSRRVPVPEALVCKLVLMIKREVVYYRQLLVLLHGRYAACAPLLRRRLGVIHAVDAIIYNVLRRTRRIRTKL